jgi:hypothetical protein
MVKVQGRRRGEERRCVCVYVIWCDVLWCDGGGARREEGGGEGYVCVRDLGDIFSSRQNY